MKMMTVRSCGKLKLKVSTSNPIEPKELHRAPIGNAVYGTTNAIYGTTNVDAGVGIGLKGGLNKID